MDGPASRPPPGPLEVNRSFQPNRLAGRWLAQAYQHLVPVTPAAVAPPPPLAKTRKEMVRS